MRRAGSKWGFKIKFQYIVIIFIIFWALNILIFQHPPSSREIDEVFEHTMAIGITSTLRKDAQARREAVRATWLKLAPSKTVKGVFVIGRPDCQLTNKQCDPATQQLLDDLDQEISENNDILYVSSTDSYSGLALKTFAFHCWAHDHFPNLKYSMKTDDDIFVRIDTIVQNLKSMPKDHLYWGFTWKKAPKVDLKTHKNYEANYEPPEYPSFNSGVGNILSADLVKYIATNRHLLRPLSNEDVTIGTWLSTLNVKPTHDTRFQAHTGMCFEDMVTKHPVTPTEMTMFYDRVNARVPLCTNVESYACPYGRVCQEQQVSWTQGLTCDETGCAPVARSESTTEAEAARARMLLASVSSIPASDSSSSLSSSVSSVSQLDVFCAPAAHQEVKPFLDGNLAANPGFETFLDNVAVGWDNFYDGYTLDKKLESSHPLHKFKKSAACLFLSSSTFNGEQAYGATQIVQVGQELPLPILLTGWARTKNIVHGPEALPQDISIYVHITFNDDSRDLQVTIDIGESDDWQFYTKLYYPSKPVKEVSLSVLFSRNKGNIWFDDIQILSLDSKKSLCAASYVVRSVPELTLPTIVRYEGDQMISVFPNPLSCSAIGPRFILIWTTGEESFKLHHLRVLESIFYHHPDACIRIFTNTLGLMFFSALAFSGYDVRVMRYDLRQIAARMPGEEWLNDIDKWKTGQHFYAHSSDFLRFLLLYRFGGIYSDFDSILVQPLSLSKLSTDFIGVEWCEAEGLAWCVAIKDSTFVEAPKQPKITPPSNTFSFSIGLMGFSLGSSFLKEILLRFVTDYSQTRWGCGTVLASIAYKQNPDTYKIAIVPPHLFYPIGYQDIVQYFSEDDTILWSDIKQNSYAFHLFGKVSGKEKIQKESLVAKALSNFVLLKYTSINY